MTDGPDCGSRHSPHESRPLRIAQHGTNCRPRHWERLRYLRISLDALTPTTATGPALRSVRGRESSFPRHDSRSRGIVQHGSIRRPRHYERVRYLRILRLDQVSTTATRPALCTVRGCRSCLQRCESNAGHGDAGGNAPSPPIPALLSSPWPAIPPAHSTVRSIPSRLIHFHSVTRLTPSKRAAAARFQSVSSRAARSPASSRPPRRGRPGVGPAFGVLRDARPRSTVPSPITISASHDTQLPDTPAPSRLELVDSGRSSLDPSKCDWRRAGAGRAPARPMCAGRQSASSVALRLSTKPYSMA